MNSNTKHAFAVTIRENGNKGAINILRNSEMVPGILYGDNKENIKLTLKALDVSRAMENLSFFSSIYELNFGDKTEKALIKDLHFHPLTNKAQHIDFLRVAKGMKITLNVPINFIGDDVSPGIKRGGILNIVLHNLEINCLPDNVPENILIDISNLNVNDSIHTDAITLPKGSTLINSAKNLTIATIVAPSSLKSEDGEKVGDDTPDAKDKENTAK